MTLPPFVPGLWAVTLLIGLAGPACADGNHLLPFWGQPYPFGYAYTPGQMMEHEQSGCNDLHRAESRRGPYHASPARCEIVLPSRG